MTGQLFVVPAGGPTDPYVQLVFELDGRPRDPVPRHPQVRPHRPVRRGPGDRRSVREGGAGVFAAGSEPLTAFTVAAFRRRLRARKGRLKPLLLDQTFLAGIGNIYADEALWAARLHPLRTARTAAAARRAAPLRAHPARSSPRRSIRRGSSIDDYTAPDGDGDDAGAPAGLPADRRAVPALRPADPADRRRRRARRISARGASGCRPRIGPAPRRSSRRRRTAGAARRALDGAAAGEGSVGLTPAERTARDRRPDGADAAGGRDPPGGGAAPRSAAHERLMSILRLDRRPAGDRHVRHPRLDRRRRSRSATGSGSSARTAPARRRCCGSPPAVDEPDGGEVAAEARPDARPARPGVALRRGVHGRARPPGGGPPRRRRTSSAMAAELAALEAAHRVDRARYAELQHRFERPRRLHARPARRRGAVAGSGSAGRRGRGRRRRCRAASRPAPRWPGSSSPTPTCCSSTSRRTTSTSTRSSGSRSTSGAARGSLLVASHDRAFLDATVTRVWELRDRRLTAFRGDYSAYHRQREERDARAAKDAETRRRRSRASGSSSSDTAASASTRRCTSTRRGSSACWPTGARRREPAAGCGCRRRARRRRRRRAPATIACGSRTSSSAMPGAARRRGRASTAVPGRGPVPLLVAQRGERIGIVGPNGAGKTTLLRTIAGELPPLDGTLSFGRARPARATSPSCAARRSRARPSSTPCSRRCRSTPGEARAYLARFLFRGDDVFKEVRTLSGGERSRLELALLGIMPSNLLLLDEPTNHLDIPAREAIEAFMRETPATLLVVSHDRRLLETICDGCGSSATGSAAPFDGGYRAWRAAVADGWTVAGGRRGGGAPAADGRAAVAGVDRRTASGADVGDRARPPRRTGGRRAGAAAPRRPRPARPRPDEALEGRLSPPEGGGRGGADPARPAQEPPRAGDGRPGGRRELRRAAAGHERAGRRRRGARRRPRRPGSSSRSGRRDRRADPDRPDRPDRLRQVDGRAAGSAERGAVVIDADARRARGDGARRAGARRGRSAVRRRVPAAATACLDRARARPDRVRRPGGASGPRGDRPSRRPAADPGGAIADADEALARPRS